VDDQIKEIEVYRLKIMFKSLIFYDEKHHSGDILRKLKKKLTSISYL